MDLVRAREKEDKLQSKINTVTVKKESFQLTIEETPTAADPASREPTSKPAATEPEGADKKAP